MKPLTEKQTLILAFIEDHLEQHSYPPTIREVADRFGISIKGGYDHLKALEKKGVLKLGVNRSRAIEVVRRERERVEVDMSEVPVLGSVAAGRPIFADENFEGSVRVPYEMTRNRPCFALRVRGDSMRDAGILDGDIAVIEERPVAADGEIVVAMIDDSVTLKRFFRETGRIRLAAENPAFAPIYTQDARILGRLRGVLRVY